MVIILSSEEKSASASASLLLHDCIYCSDRFSLLFFFFLRVIFLYIYLQWEHKVEKGEEDFGKISKLIQKEMARFEVRKTHCTSWSLHGEQKTSKQSSLQ